MKYLFPLLIWTVLSGCTNNPENRNIPHTVTKTTIIRSLPEDAFPFRFDGSHMIIQASLNGSDTISLLLDTGIQNPIFDSAFISENRERLHIRTIPFRGYGLTPGGLLRITQKIDGTITINAFSEKRKLHGALLVAGKIRSGAGADALFPASLFFKGKAVLFDLSNQYLRFLNQDTLNKIKRQFVSWPLHGSPYSYFSVDSKIVIDKIPDQTVKLKGEMQIDLGAPGFIYLFASQKYVQANLPAGKEVRVVTSLAMNMTDSVSSEAMMCDRLLLSDAWSFKRVKLTLLKDFINMDPTQIGLLGNNFLRRFIFILDYRNRILYLRPGPEYLQPVRTPTLGMRLRKDNNDSSIRVVSIYRQSSPSLAGIRLGDKVLSVDGISGRDLTPEKLDSIQFSPVGTTLKFRIQRGEKVSDREITVKEIW
jgi:hypothetical protein